MRAGCDLDLLDEQTSGLPPTRQTDIISLFIRRHGSKLALCQTEKRHFGALPSQLRIEKFVKVGHRVSSSRRREGAMDQRHPEQEVVPTGRHPHFAKAGYRTEPRELCSECQIKSGSVSFVSVSALILLFTNCSAESTR